jgi:hypothetical protein
MHAQKEKAGPVATGTDLRNTVLANGPEHTHARTLSQAAAKQLARVVFSSPPPGIVAAIGNNGLPYWRVAR